jgi:lantibiotic transport system ATP-binding protein
MNIIEAQNINFQYSTNHIILENVNLNVPKGSIYGFLGQNGAGKTTTLRLILGLLKNQSGSIKIFEKSFEKNRIEILQKVGLLIENPSIYGHLTAFENLLVWQKVYQCPKSNIQETLDLVGLENTGNKKTSHFSLGMKQRLAIASALLHQPEILILDEPTNGLDPNGIVEMRELLKKLNQEKAITILISSHLLSEIEKLATHVGIIHKGKILFEDTLESLLIRQQLNTNIFFETNQNTYALKLISQHISEAKIIENKLIIPQISDSKIAEINQKLVENGIEIYQISKEKNDLERIFMNLTTD